MGTENAMKQQEIRCFDLKNTVLHHHNNTWAQLFEGRLALTQGQILIWVSLFLYSKAFLGKFSVSFSKHQIVILQTKRIRLNFLLKLLDLKSDFTLTLGYLNPALNNPALLTQEHSRKTALVYEIEEKINCIISQYISRPWNLPVEGTFYADTLTHTYSQGSC